MDSKAKKCLDLFKVFFKIGAFTFGGGYAMIPLIKREVSEKRDWIKEEEILDVIAVAESTPGPIAINSATFIGTRRAGWLGALCATMGVVVPSFLIIFIISIFFRQFADYEVVKFALMGLRAGVLALIIKALFSMAKHCPKNGVSYGIAAAAFIASVFFGTNVFVIILCCAVTGLAFSFTPLGKEKEAE